MSLRSTSLALTVIAAAIGCSDHPTAVNPPPPPPPPGSAVVTLTTPKSDDGALRLTLRGPGLSSLQSASAATLFYSRMVSDSEARVIVVGDLVAGQLFSFKLAAGRTVSAYATTLDEVASRGDTLRSSLQGYALTVTTSP